nr:hypothetical protein [Solirubrobacterales bacterium]
MDTSRNIAARAGRWSATHRKTAIWGWLAFVILAVFIGGSVGTRTLTDAEDGVGESGRAEVATSNNFPENATERVLITAPAASIWFRCSVIVLPSGARGTICSSCSDGCVSATDTSRSV